MYGMYELWAYSPFNGDNKCGSKAGRDNYTIPQEAGKNALTNQKGNKFTITELEVWSIKEIVRKIILLIGIGRMITGRENRQCILLY